MIITTKFIKMKKLKVKMIYFLRYFIGQSLEEMKIISVETS